jgi:hypothetical protein
VVIVVGLVCVVLVGLEDNGRILDFNIEGLAVFSAQGGVMSASLAVANVTCPPKPLTVNLSRM